MTIKKIEDGWLVDIRPQGRAGRRVRRVFDLKVNAEAFEREVFRDQERMMAGAASEMSVLDLFDRFRDTYAKVRMRGYEYSEKYKIARMRKFYESRPQKIGRFRLGDAEVFIAHRKEMGCKPGGINRDINLLKRVFNWAVEGDMLPYSPLAKLKHLKGVKARCRWLTREERVLVLETCKRIDPDIWFSVLVALETGFRLTNVEQLVPEDFQGDFVTAKRTKSGEPYQVPISDNLRQALPLFAAGKYKMGTQLGRRFRKVLKTCGLYFGEGNPETVTFHTLRHTFASYWLQRGVPIYTVSKWMGHSSVKVTEETYGHLCAQHHVETMRKFSETGGQNVDRQIIQFPEKASLSSCPQGESNPCFGLERIDPDMTDV